MLTGKKSSPCITIPANRVRMPYQHRTHLNILRQGPRHLPDKNQSPKLHQQARYRLPDTVNQTVRTLAQKLQTIYDLRNVENYANIRHRRRHYPENTSTILHQQHRNNKHLQRSQNAYPYKSPSWTRWWWALESLNTNHNFTHHLLPFPALVKL